MKKISLILLSIGLISTACNKTNSPQYSAGNSRNQHFITMSEECNTLDFTAADIGAIHNETVVKLYEGVDPLDSAAAYLKIRENFIALNTDRSVFGISDNEYNEKIFAISDELKQVDYDLRRINDNEITSSPAYPYICSILNEVDSLSDYNRFLVSISQIQADAEMNLTCTDKDIVIAALNIAKGSAELWLSESLGGAGFYESTLPCETMISQKVKNLIKYVLVADINALAIDFIKMGVLIAAGMEVPGANVAILTSLAIDAAYNSALAGIGSWFY